MKKIKIFLASSINDLKEDRIQLGDYFRQLNEVYIDRGVHFSLIKCEDYDNSIVLSGKQSQYDREIEDSELCIFLFFRRVGEYTLHEFEVALKAFREKAKPRIVTYIKYIDSMENTPDEVLSFMNRLDGELRHYYNTYGHIDTLKLGVLMQIKLLSLDELSGVDMSVSDGNVMLEDKPLIDTSNVPIFSGNEALKELMQRKKQLSIQLREKRAAYIASPTEENEAEFFDASAEFNEVSKKLQQLEREALALVSTVAEITSDGRVLTHRQREALKRFNLGDYTAAQELLDGEEREGELKLSMERSEEARREISGYVEENLLWIKAERAKGITPEGVKKIKEKYERAAELIFRYSLDLSPVYEYALFLDAQKDYDMAAQVCERAISALVGGDGATLAAYLVLLGSVYTAIRRFDEAERSLVRAVNCYAELRMSNPGAYVLDAAAAYNDLGILYRSLKRFCEAERAYLSSLELYGTEGGGSRFGRLALASGYHNLAGLYAASQRYAEAEEKYLSAIEVYSELSLPRNDDVLANLAQSKCGLGVLYKTLGRYPEAKEITLETMDIYSEICKRNPEAYEGGLAKCHLDLGRIYESSRSHGDARVEYDTALAIFERLYAKSSEAYATSLALCHGEMGLFFSSTNEFSLAEAHLKLALDIRLAHEKENSKADLADIAASRGNLGALYMKMGRLRDAEEQLEAAASTYGHLCLTEDVFSDLYSNVCCNLAYVYKSVGKYAEAEEKFLISEKILKRLAELHPEVYQTELAKNYCNFGIFYTELGRPYEALKLLSLAKSTFEAALSGDNPEVLGFLGNTANNLARLYAKMKKYGEAERECDVAKKALLKLREISGNMAAPELASTYNMLGVIYSRTERAKMAEEAFTNACQIRGMLADKRPDVYLSSLADSTANLGLLYKSLGLTDKAEAAFSSARTVLTEGCKFAPEQNEPTLAKICFALGELCFDMGKFEAANEAYGGAAEIWRRLSLSNPTRFSQSLARALSKLGATFDVLNNPEAAVTASDEALPIYRSLAASGDVYTRHQLATALTFAAAAYSRIDKSTAVSHMQEAVELYKAIESVSPGSLADRIRACEKFIRANKQ